MKFFQNLFAIPNRLANPCTVYDFPNFLMSLSAILFYRILLARLEYLRDTFQIKEGDFLTFDALVCFLTIDTHFIFI